MTVMGRVRLNCPHCGGAITVRVNAPDEKLSKDQTTEFLKRSDEMFRTMREAFARVFDPKLRKRK